MWLYTSGEGTLEMGEVNPDAGHCPSLLVEPVLRPVPAVFTTGVATTATFQFDGMLGVGSSVAVVGSGTVSPASIGGSTLTFQYTAATGDVLKFNVNSANGIKTARRLFTPTTITLGPSYVPGSLTRTNFCSSSPS